MSHADSTKSLRDRLTGSTEDRLGKALVDLFDNPLVNGALGRASDAREKAVQAQELAMGALNLPSAADIERLTRRLRSVSQRLEGIEDGVHRIGRTLSGPGVDSRLAAIEEQLKALAAKLDAQRSAGAAGGAKAAAAPTSAADTAKAARSAAKAAGATSGERAATATTAGAPAGGKRVAAKRSAAGKRSKPARQPNVRSPKG